VAGVIFGSIFFIKVLLENYGLIKYYYAGTMDTSEQVKVTAANGETQSFSCSYWTGSVRPTYLSLYTFWLTLCANYEVLSLFFNLLIDYFGILIFSKKKLTRLCISFYN
jgi:hypothetical protein